MEIFRKPSLQMVSFTITEKGYSVSPADLERGAEPQLIMGKVTALLYERYQAGALPITVQSMDNCSHNGDKVRSAAMAYAETWVKAGLVPQDFLEYLKDESKVSFPWSMIDKITPRPDAKVQKMLEEDGFEDNYTIITDRHTYTAPFVNAEETEYLVIEDQYTNGRPPLEQGGVLYADRETVDKVEKMKVCTCLNPLHTAMSIYGCLLDYTLISAEMKDEDLCGLITKMGYIEAMPVVAGSRCAQARRLYRRGAEQASAQPLHAGRPPAHRHRPPPRTLSIRFGETIKAYQAKGPEHGRAGPHPPGSGRLRRYLKGVNDAREALRALPRPPAGGAFRPS